MRHQKWFRTRSHRGSILADDLEEPSQFRTQVGSVVFASPVATIGGPNDGHRE